MKRHFALAVGTMLAVLTSLTFSAGRADAQTPTTTVPGAGLLADPFSFYYAIYLPNQQLQAMRPTPLDSVNGALVERQYFSQQSSRRGLYDPISPYAETYDPLRPFSNQQERVARPYRFTHQPSNNSGTGPSLYYNRIHQYYPEMAGRSARHSNANVSARRGGTRGSMGGGMPGGMGGTGMGAPGMGMF